MKVGIIGGGLGGLLSGTALARDRHDVRIFEKLPRCGGRFTNIEYRGYQLSTGAMHLIPHGATGPLGSLLMRLGVKVPILRTTPPGLFKMGGSDYTHQQLPDLFDTWDRVKLIKLTADLRYSKGGDEPYSEWVRKRIKHKRAADLANSFCRWALSVDADEVSSREVLSIARNIDRYGSAGVPIGGCKAISDALVSEIEKNGGEIHLKTPVDRIIAEDGRIKGLAISRESLEFDAVISNIGPKATASLCQGHTFSEKEREKLSTLQPANGIKISFSSDVPLVGHTCPMFTPEAERVAGLVEFTHLDPSLSPKGMYLLMCHQKYYGGDVKTEAAAGLADLRVIFPEFDDHCEVLMVQSYRDHWPVNRVASGIHVGPETEIKGLYNVGDGIKPKGFMETEGVAAGVERMLEKFHKELRGV